MWLLLLVVGGGVLYGKGNGFKNQIMGKFWAPCNEGFT